MTGRIDKSLIVIIPCSGIGKTYGTVSREAAYCVTEDICPESTRLVALSKLVVGEEEARAEVVRNPIITIDGCQLACASKMVQECGGEVTKDYSVLEVYRRYKQFKPKGISQLNEGGEQLAWALAVEIALVVNELTADQGGIENG